MRLLLFILLYLSFGCKNYIEVKDTDVRQHRLRYFKNTSTLVTGQVISKSKDGIVMDLTNYDKGKAVGDWFQYDDKGKIMSQGIGVEIKKYESSLNGFDLTYSILSIVQIENRFSYATLYMDNKNLFDDNKKIIQLAKAVFADYSSKYPIDNLLIFDNNHEYSISKSATMKTNFIVDTIQNARLKKVNIH